MRASAQTRTPVHVLGYWRLTVAESLRLVGSPRPVPPTDTDQTVHHEVTAWEWLVAGVLRLRIPRALCGAVLLADPTRVTRDVPGPDALPCPRCATRGEAEGLAALFDPAMNWVRRDLTTRRRRSAAARPLARPWVSSSRTRRIR